MNQSRNRQELANGVKAYKRTSWIPVATHTSRSENHSQDSKQQQPKNRRHLGKETRRTQTWIAWPNA
jgi:hypothetical protein